MDLCWYGYCIISITARNSDLPRPVSSAPFPSPSQLFFHILSLSPDTTLCQKGCIHNSTPTTKWNIQPSCLGPNLELESETWKDTDCMKYTSNQSPALFVTHEYKWIFGTKQDIDDGAQINYDQ